MVVNSSTQNSLLKGSSRNVRVEMFIYAIVAEREKWGGNPRISKEKEKICR